MSAQIEIINCVDNNRALWPARGSRMSDSSPAEPRRRIRVPANNSCKRKYASRQSSDSERRKTAKPYVPTARYPAATLTSATISQNGRDRRESIKAVVAEAYEAQTTNMQAILPLLKKLRL